MSTRAEESDICPHCGVGVRFETAEIIFAGRPVLMEALSVRAPSKAWLQLHLSACPICGQPIVSIPCVGPPNGGQMGGPGLVYPAARGRAIPPEVQAAAPSLAADFREAAAVLGASRKASAALSRRCLQFILTHVGGAKKRDLADQIDEVLPKLPPQIAENVDAIRHVGNFAAHPLKSTNTGEIVEVEDGEAEWLLDVLSELMDFYYVANARAAARRAALNQKLQELGKPALKKP